MLTISKKEKSKIPFLCLGCCHDRKNYQIQQVVKTFQFLTTQTNFSNFIEEFKEVYEL